jgi:hypothetical protein
LPHSGNKLIPRSFFATIFFFGTIFIHKDLGQDSQNFLGFS